MKLIIRIVMGPVLVVGVGALGCEILSKLVLIGYQNIFVVDSDTVELSNLNRQLLFNTTHIGKFKAQVAASTINHLYPTVNCEYRVGMIEALPSEFFHSFELIFCAVDNIVTRLWLSAVAYERGITMIEGGTEGRMGHVRLIRPTTACLFCTKYLYVERDTLPICMLAGQPTLPEHCLGWALTLEWSRICAGVEFNPNDEEHIRVLSNLAIQRASSFNVEGVNFEFVRGALKRIIPAIVSTTTFIAGLCTLVAQQLSTDNLHSNDNYWFYNGQTGLVFESHNLERDPDCAVCCKIMY
jgi:ubiquitin-activating enzyme E1 C